MKILTTDIGGTAIKYAYMTEKTEVLSRGKVPTPHAGRAELIDAIAQLYEAEDGVDGIAISMPGIIDRKQGYIVMGGGQMPYNDDFYLRHALYQRCPVHISMENDAKCAATAEATVGALADVDDSFVIILGTMIGGGYIHHHKLVRGKHFSAGEVSYITTDHDGTADAAGIWGNQCSTPALCAAYAERKGIDPAQVDGLVVFNAVNAGEPDALAVLNHYCRALAVQIFNIQTVLDPQRFAIGGGISAQPALIESIRANLDQLYAHSPFHVPHAEVVACKYQNDANLVGALQCFLQDVKEGTGAAEPQKSDEPVALVNDFENLDKVGA